MSDHSQTIITVCAVGTFIFGTVVVGGSKIGKKIVRVAQAVEQVAGKPAEIDRSGAVVEPARPGLPVQVAVIRQLAERAIGGNDEIIRRQDEAAVAHQRLAGRVTSIESKVSQTLNVVSQ